MSRVYDNWEKLVGAVLKREELRRIALCESFSSSSSVDFSSRLSFNFAPGGVVADYRNSSERFDPADASSQRIFLCRNVMEMQFEEIKLATKNFHPKMLLGAGGFGLVFKGWIHERLLTAVKPGSGIAVAVKKITDGTLEWHKKWSDEINYLSQLCHPNIIKLKGYCFEQNSRVLIYEFMPKGSLDSHLLTRGHQSLSWATRIKVAIGVARALSFLHDLAMPVTYCGLKTGDILLDDEFNAKLSDFGLATDGPTGDMTPVSALVVGLYGYAAPECLMTGRLTTKCDVYSFGVVLLQLLSGLRVIDGNRPLGRHNLADWAKPYLVKKKSLLRIVDTRLEGEYPPEGAYKFAKLANQCLSSNPKLRPRMAEVVVALEKL